MKNDLQIALVQYNKKTWCKSALLGLLIGLAVIVPGVSGSTVAIIFKLYDQFLYALGNLFKQFKICFAFLLPIGLGIFVGLVLGFLAVKKMLALLPFAFVCLFAGLMLGAFPAVKDEINDAKRTPRRIILFCVGLALPVALGCISAVLTTKESIHIDVFENVHILQVVGAVFVGAMMAISQIVPGLSASAILMAIGWFSGIVDSVSISYWQSNPEVFFIYGGLLVGVLLGIFGTSKLLSWIFAKARHAAYFVIVGLSLGSVLTMFCNGDVMAVYYSWAHDFAKNMVLDIVLGVVFFVLGTALAYMLVCYQRKKNAQKAAQENLGENANETV